MSRIAVIPGDGIGVEVIAVPEAVLTLVLEPGRFDVIVASNLFGDIPGDLAAARMLEHPRHAEAATSVLSAVGSSLADPASRTRDLGGNADTATAVPAIVSRIS